METSPSATSPTDSELSSTNVNGASIRSLFGNSNNTDSFVSEPAPKPVADVEHELEKPCRRRAKFNNNTNRLSTMAVTGDRQAQRAEREIVANNESVPNTNSTAAREENDRTLAEFEENTYTNEEIQKQRDSDTQPIASIGDPNLPATLSIGGDFGTAELFSLAKSSFRSKQQAKLFLGLNDLSNLYGVQTNEQITAMQVAFGVKTSTATPPIVAYLQQQCRFKGFNLVKAALKRRLQIIQESRVLERNNFNQRRLQVHMNWIESTLTKMAQAKKPCPSPTAVATATQTNGTGICPCLDELKFMRYLVYLMLLLQGHASPEVKRQIEGIQISKLLELVEKGNTTNATQALLQAIQSIQQLAEAGANTGRDCSEELKQIYQALRKSESVPNEVKVEDILAIIEENVRQLESFAQSAARVKDLEDELAEKETVLATMKLKVAELESMIATTGASSETLQGQLAEKETALTEKNTALAGKNTELASQREAVVQLTARITELSVEKTALEQQIQSLTDSASTERDELEQQIQSLSDQITDLTTQKTAMEQEIQLLTSTSTAKNQTIADRETELTRLRSQIAERETELTGIRGQLASAQAELGTKEATITSLTQQLADANATIQTQLATIQNLTQQVQTKTDELEEARRNLEECTQARAANSTKQTELETQLAAAKAAHDELQTKLDTETNNKEQIQRDLTTAKARIDALESELAATKTTGTEQETQHAQALQVLEEQLTKLTAAGETLTDRVTAAEAATREAEATIEDLRGKLQTEKDGRQANIQRLEGDLQAARANSTQKGDTIATLEQKLRNAQSTIEQAKQEATALRNVVNGKESEIKTLQQASTEKDAAIAAEKSALEKQLQAAQAEQATILASKQASNAQHTKQLEELTQRLQTAEQLLTTSQTASQATNERLQKLLGILALDPEMLQQAKNFMAGDDSAEATLQADICSFFRYLYDLIGIQMRAIHTISIFPNNSTTDQLYKEDVFSIFKNFPVYKPNELLVDLSKFFQELFSKGILNTITNPIVLSDNFETLRLILANIEFDLDTNDKQSIQRFLQGGQLFQSFGVQIDETTGKLIVRSQTSPDEFITQKSLWYIPIVFLATKYIQLLYISLGDRYEVLAKRCGIPVKNDHAAFVSAIEDDYAAKAKASSLTTPSTSEETEFQLFLKTPEGEEYMRGKEVCNQTRKYYENDNKKRAQWDFYCIGGKAWDKRLWSGQQYHDIIKLHEHTLSTATDYKTQEYEASYLDLLKKHYQIKFGKEYNPLTYTQGQQYLIENPQPSTERKKSIVIHTAKGSALKEQASGRSGSLVSSSKHHAYPYSR